MRPTWDAYFMEMAEVTKNRSTCLRRQVGAILVKDKRILASGYNGAPTGLKHCEETGCLRQRLNIPSGERHELCRGIHAEQNAIIQAALHGVKIQGATLYVTLNPCILCTKLLINSGIERVVFKGSYPDDFSLSMLEEAGIKLEKFE